MQNKSTILTLLDRQNPDKANIQTLIEIVKELGKIPESFTIPEKNEFDFELLSKIIWFANKQQGSDITIEEVSKKINLDNAFELLEYAKSFLTINVPKEIQRKIDEANKANEKPDDKVDGDKKTKKDVGEN